MSAPGAIPLDAFPLPVLAVGRSGRVEAASDAAHRLVGPDLIGRELAELTHGTEGPPEALHGEVVSVPLPTGVLQRCAAYVSRVGEQAVVTLVPVGQAGGSGLDVDLLADAVDAADNCIVIADARTDDTPLVYVNDGFVTLTGYTRDLALGRNCRFLQQRLDGTFDDATPMQERALGEIRRAIREGTAIDGVVIRNYRRDGSRFYNELFLTPIRDADGTLTHFVGVQNDVTARMQAEERLQMRVDSLRGVFDAMPVPLGLLERDDEGQIAHAFGNAAAADAFGLPEGGGALLDGLGFTAAARRTWADAMARADRFDAPVRFEAPRTDARTFEVTVSPLGDAPDRPGRFFYLATDVTEGRALADDLMQVSARQLERVAQDIHDGVGQTLVGAGMAAAALAQSVGPDGGRAAREAARVREMLVHALGQLRSFALGLDPLDVERTGLAGALARLASDARAVLGVEVQMRTAGLDGLTPEQATDLVRIVQEALTNAVRHGQASRVTIAAERDDDGGFALTVEDDGAGIADGADGHAEGVGLRSMRIRARRLGGTFEIGRSADGGTRVSVHVPG